MNINKDLAMLNMSLPFTEDEFKEKYRHELIKAVSYNDKELALSLTKSFWNIHNSLRRNPFLNDKEGLKKVKENQYIVQTVKVTEKCKKCAPVYIGRDLAVPSGKAKIVCPRCDGNKRIFIPSKGAVICSRCKGSGIARVKCKYCKGTGKVKLKRKIFISPKEESNIASNEEQNGASLCISL